MSHRELHKAHRGGWLRAAVLGANDGIVSTASLVLGVAAADASPGGVVTAGLAGLVGGALSMAAGEYVSVSTQRDAEQADLERERVSLRDDPAFELEELVGIYQDKGLEPALAREVAEALMRGDGLRVHARDELNIDPDALAAPGQAAWSSALAFACGAALPLAAMIVSPAALRVGVTLGIALLALGGLGGLSAHLGGAPVGRAVIRVVIGGGLAMGLTMAIGALFGVATG